MLTRRIRNGQKFLLSRPAQPSKYVHLFNDEIVALQMLADGEASQEVCRRLALPQTTLRAVRDMLEAKTMAHAVAVALRIGVIR